jgi:uncharacterized membrane protein YdjX (TVP38/TMEM64 family)
LEHVIDFQAIRQQVISYGIFSPLIFICLTAVSNILPSIAALPLWLIGVSLFGFPGYLYILVSNTLGSSINYYLARRWGRLVLQKVVGAEGLRQVDKLAQLISPQTIFLLRLVGGSLSDYLSYAAGLMQIGFRVYLIATVFGSLPMMMFAFIVISVALEKGLLATAGLFGIFYTVNYLTSFLIIPLVINRLGKSH